MITKPKIFSGISRPIPDVPSFITPIFFDDCHNSFIQNINGEHVTEFKSVSLGEEFTKLEISLELLVGEPPFYGFETISGNLLIGTASFLAVELKEYQKLDDGFDNSPDICDYTWRAINRFIDSFPINNVTEDESGCQFVIEFLKNDDGTYNILSKKTFENTYSKLRYNHLEKDVVSSPANVLLVDDSVHFLQYLSKYVENTGFVPIIAHGGQEAEEILNNQNIDIVLLDLFMPDINGLELTRRIRSNSKFSDLPIIMISSSTEKIDRDKASHAGVNNFLGKEQSLQVKLPNYMSFLLNDRLIVGSR